MVRTDLVRQMPCHVADSTIMGNCMTEQVVELQSLARQKFGATEA